MAWWLSRLTQSGSKKNCHLTADDERELSRAAEKLRVEIHGKGWQERHLDLNPRKRELALRYGARERDDDE